MNLILFVNGDTPMFKVVFNKFRDHIGDCPAIGLYGFLKSLIEFLIDIDMQPAGRALMLLFPARLLGVISGHVIGYPVNKTTEYSNKVLHLLQHQAICAEQYRHGKAMRFSGNARASPRARPLPIDWNLPYQASHQPTLHSIVTQRKDESAMLIHMTETNETAKIVDFSFRMKDYDDPSLTLDDALRQIRFHAIRVLNKHAAGEVELTPNLKKSLKWYNKYCNMADLEKLKLPF